MKPGEPKPPKSHKQQRWEMLDRQYNPDNPDYTTPVVGEKAPLKPESNKLLLDSIDVGNIISYQGKNYEVKELPSEQNGNRYILAYPGEPVFKASEKQLTMVLESGKAALVLPETKSQNNKEETPLPLSALADKSPQPPAPAPKEKIVGSCFICGKPLAEANMFRAYGTMFCTEHIPPTPEPEFTPPPETKPEPVKTEKPPEPVRPTLVRTETIQDSETKTFSEDFIKDKIRILLVSNKNIEEVKSLEVRGIGNKITLDLKVLAGPLGSEIRVQAVLEGDIGGIKVKNHKIDAGWMIKGTVESILVPKLNEISELLRSFIESEEKKKVEKMEIVNGELKVTFVAEKAKAKPQPEPKPELGPLEPEPFIKPKEAEKLAALPKKEALGKIADKLEVERVKTEAIIRLKQKIERLRTAIEENEQREQAILDRLAEINKEKQKEKTGGPEKERKEELEKDRQKNPFKYFLIDKIHPINFQIIFGTNKENVSLKNINHILGETGQELKIFDFKQISPINRNTVHCTSNGFTLQLQNPDEVIDEKDGEKIIMIDSPKAKYKLVGPDWNYNENEAALNYQGGRELLVRRAREYQEQQLFEYETGSLEGVKNLIEKELQELRELVERNTKTNNLDTAIFFKNHIELLESNPIEYFTRKRNNEQGTLDFVSTEKYAREHTPEETKEVKASWAEKVRRFQKIIDILEK